MFWTPELTRGSDALTQENTSQGSENKGERVSDWHSKRQVGLAKSVVVDDRTAKVEHKWDNILKVIKRYEMAL